MWGTETAHGAGWDEARGGFWRSMWLSTANRHLEHRSDLGIDYGRHRLSYLGQWCHYPATWTCCPDRCDQRRFYFLRGGDGNDQRIQQDTAESTWTNGTLKDHRGTLISTSISIPNCPPDERIIEAKARAGFSRILRTETDGLFKPSPELPITAHLKGVCATLRLMTNCGGSARRVMKDWFPKRYGGMIEVRGAEIGWTHEGYVG